MTPTELAKSGTEHSHQRALFAWASMACLHGMDYANEDISYVSRFSGGRPSKPIPQLKWLHAIHNQGHGDIVRGSRAKAEGVKAGVADLFLPWPMELNCRSWNGQLGDEVVSTIYYHGLYIEMKREDKGKLSVIQSEFARDIQSVGYKWVCCFGWKSARDEILKYLGLV